MREETEQDRFMIAEREASRIFGMTFSWHRSGVGNEKGTLQMHRLVRNPSAPDKARGDQVIAAGITRREARIVLESLVVGVHRGLIGHLREPKPEERMPKMYVDG